MAASSRQLIVDITDFNALLAWITQHPDWAYSVIFIAACAESLVLVGFIFPGALVMLSAGAFVAAGALDFALTLACAVAGAVAGDSFSYWLGRRYRIELRTLWPFRRYPKLLSKGMAFFRHRGSKSVFLGRFVGPVRPVIPVVAGMLGMPPMRFHVSNILSALVWAPSYILPGVVFGAALGLAGTVAMRLAMLIMLLIFFGWVGLWLVRHGLIWVQLGAERGLVTLQSWAGHSQSASPWSLRGMVATLLDPVRPASRALGAFAVILIAAAWTFLRVIDGVLNGAPLTLLDKAVYHLLQGLRTPLADSIMISFTQLGDTAVTLPLFGAVLLWLAWRRAWRQVAYWLAAAGFAAVLTVILKAGFGLPRPLPMYEGSIAFGFPSGHAAMGIVIFGFLAVLTVRELSLRGRLAVFSMVVLLAGLIAFSRIYLGAHWLSDVLGGLSFGVAWVALLGIAYLRRPAKPIAARGLLAVATATLIFSAIIHAAYQRDADAVRYAVQRPTSVMTQQDWWQHDWQTLASWRIDIEGEYEQPLTVQWAGQLDFLRARLIAQGWQPALPLSATRLLLWLDPRRPAMQLPLLPHVHDGRYETLAMYYPLANSPRQRLVLRLWPTEAELQSPRTPVWVGTVTMETMLRPLGWFNLPRDGPDFNHPRQILQNSLNGLPIQLVAHGAAPATANEEVVWDKQVLLTYQPESMQ